MQSCPGGGPCHRACRERRARAEAASCARTRCASVRALVHVLLLLASLSVAGPRARADEPWLLHIEALGGAPVSAPQRDWYGGGGSLSLGVARPLVSWLALEARLRTALFLDGETPRTPGVRDPGLGTLNSAMLGATLRIPDGTKRRGTSLWAGGNFGIALTGKEARATFEAALGYGFALPRHIDLGPVVRYVQVIQPDGLSSSDARIVLGGLQLTFFDGRTPSAPVLHDKDGDGIADEQDRCIDVPEDRDGFEDTDGCPESDNDGDGIPDKSDGCPNIAEDKDGFQDEDGCPDEDNDRDGILDADDQCPLEPETINGERDDDGCPDQGLIVMRDDRVVLEERVLFDTLSARIKKSAEPVLRAIINLQTQHPEWTKVRIEGHADVRGGAELNQQLSERRATSVREALIELGMKPELVVAEGYGATRLLTTETTEEAHRMNRRVEFVVIARHEDRSAPLLTPREPGTTPARDKEQEP